MKTNSLWICFGFLGMGAGSLMGTDPVVMPTNQVYGWKMSGPVMSVQNLPSEQDMGAPTDPCCEGTTPLQWQFLGTSNEWGSAVVLSEGTPRLDTETSGQKSVSATVRYRWKCKEDVQAKAKDALPALNWVIRVTGLEISTNGVALSSAPTNYVAWASNGAVMATARITPSDAPTNTTWNGWSFTGGSESNRLTHTVPLSTPGFTTFIAKAGESAATNTMCVLKVDFKRDGTCSGFDDTLTPPWIMVPKSGDNTAIAEIDPAAIANQVEFVSADTNKATVSPTTASASPQTVTVSGVAKGDTEIQAKLSGSSAACATLKVSVKERINKTIAIHAITEENDDVQVIPVGQGQPNQSCITAGTNGVLDTTPAGDDTVVGATITTGPDGICNTTASGDDVQAIAVGNGKANATCVTKGANNFRDTIPAGDDVVTGDDIHTGSDGVCNTTANASNLVPTTCPTAAQLQSYLNDTIWGRQANVYFTVTKSDYTVNYDLDRSGTLAHPSKGPAPNPAEGQAISSVAKDTSVDYNIYYVYARDYSIGTTRIDLGETWTAADGANSPVNHTAHETGHLLGIGYESFNDEDVMLFEGRASNPCRVIKRDWDTVNP